MGNSSTKDLFDDPQSKRYLNLSRRLTPDEYMKHTNGIMIDGSLQTIPSDILYYDYINLFEEINLSFNYISSVPDDFSLKVPHLRHLNISHNQLAELPNSFHYLLHLKILNLSFNKFEVFPAAVTGLLKLKKIDISHNKIKELPSYIDALKELTGLNISHNNLRTLPESILNCRRLELIVTLANNLIFPPQSICDQGSRSTLEFLKRNHIPQNESKSAPTPPPPPVQIFARIRGQQVMASVSNPESASREYKQAQGTTRSNRRKCPLMVPESASELPPDRLKDTILGLVYGACIGDALALNTEGLSFDECLFFYSDESFSLRSRIQDYLRSFFPPGDWSSNVDFMLMTLDSLMRWGGVVDELELASHIAQWKVHGMSDIDPFPGHPLSSLMMQVFEVPTFSVQPHSTAESVLQRVKEDHRRGVNLHVNPDDNSCLAAALVLGVPNFYKENEVAMNAERICLATHASPLAKAACVFTALLVAALLQGKQEKDSFVSDFVRVTLREKVSSSSSLDEETKLQFNDIFEETDPLNRTLYPSNDVRTALKQLLHALRDTSLGFEAIMTDVAMGGGEGVASTGCFLGGILGAYYGYSNLPQKWLKELPNENTKWLSSKLNQLLDLFGLP